jgi:ribosomal protein L37AE/L43A
MPKREDEFWANKKESENKRYCPNCGSNSIYYNVMFQSWRCNKCEHSFTAPTSETKNKKLKNISWNEDWFKTDQENKEKISNDKVENVTLEPLENTEEKNEVIPGVENKDRITKEFRETSKINSSEEIKLDKNSKAWFGDEYFDKKSQKWKKPGLKTSTKIVSTIALLVVIFVIVLIVWIVLSNS